MVNSGAMSFSCVSFITSLHGAFYGLYFMVLHFMVFHFMIGAGMHRTILTMDIRKSVALPREDRLSHVNTKILLVFLDHAKTLGPHLQPFADSDYQGSMLCKFETKNS